jgi:hypothetical protein
MPIAIMILISALSVLFCLVKNKEQDIRTGSWLAFLTLAISFTSLALPVFYIKLDIPRYLLTGIVPLFLTVGWCVNRLSLWISAAVLKKWPGFLARGFLPQLSSMGLMLLLTLTCLPFVFTLLTDPAKTPFATSDLSQFVTGPPAGYGNRELSDIVRKELGPFNQHQQTQLALIYDNQWLWEFKLIRYIMLYPQNGVGIPPGFSIVTVNPTKNEDVYHKSILSDSRILSNVPLLVAIQATAENQEAWQKNNPKFIYVAEYNGPGVNNYKIFKYLK